jgi:hypothetical protein
VRRTGRACIPERLLINDPHPLRAQRLDTAGSAQRRAILEGRLFPGSGAAGRPGLFRRGARMKLEQISIFLENRSGRLAEITGILAQAGVNIRALSLADTADFGILRLVVNAPDTAVQVLKANGFTLAKTEMVALELPDRPGGLAGILRILHAAGINVEYMYAFVQKMEDNAIVIFRFDDPDKAVQVLVEAGVRVLGGEEVYAL